MIMKLPIVKMKFARFLTLLNLILMSGFWIWAIFQYLESVDYLRSIPSLAYMYTGASQNCVRLIVFFLGLIFLCAFAEICISLPLFLHCEDFPKVTDSLEKRLRMSFLSISNCFLLMFLLMTYNTLLIWKRGIPAIHVLFGFVACWKFLILMVYCPKHPATKSAESITENKPEIQKAGEIKSSGMYKILEEDQPTKDPEIDILISKN